MVRKDHTMVIYKGTFISDRSLSSHFLFGSPFSLCNLLPATLLVQAKLDLRNPFFDFLLTERFVSINIRAVGRSENPGGQVLICPHPTWLR